ncbi:hypothetical protein D7V91_00160 [bacterium 1xD42-67]|nr:hypothetical protein D7V91_00160 [bacterium 1xD42-67]
MRSIIGEFYLGNITPDVTVIKRTSELQKAVKEMADAESFLRENLDGECLAALERLVDAQLTTSTTTAQERYMDGFRTGAKFMLDILTGESENLAPLVQTEA